MREVVEVGVTRHGENGQPGPGSLKQQLRQLRYVPHYKRFEFYPLPLHV
jgi:hypothetical protein